MRLGDLELCISLIGISFQFLKLVFNKQVDPCDMNGGASPPTFASLANDLEAKVNCTDESSHESSVVEIVDSQGVVFRSFQASLLGHLSTLKATKDSQT